MPQNINSAYRVLQILSAAAILPTQNAVHSDKLAEHAWGEIMGITGPDTFSRTQRVAEDLSLFYAEVQDAHSKARLLAVDAALYENAFKNIYSAISLKNLSQIWRSYSQYLDSTTLTSLGFCANLIPNEEDLILQEELDAVLKTLDEIRKTVQSDPMPAQVRSFVLEQISFIERAVARYKIQGVKAFVAAVVQAQASARQDSSTAQEATKTKSMQNLMQVWERVSDLVKHADTAQKILLWGIVASDHAGKLLGGG